MDVRDAVEADAERLGELADGPRDVMRNLVHDRTVRVTVEEGTADAGEGAATGNGDDGSATGDLGDGDADGGAGPADGAGSDQRTADGEDATVTGFVSFDAREGTVHVTQLAGDEDALERLLEEPIRFAEREEMTVELLVPDGEETVKAAAEDADFAHAGSGPRFEGTPTTRYRLETGKARQ